MRLGFIGNIFQKKSWNIEHARESLLRKMRRTIKKIKDLSGCQEKLYYLWGFQGNWVGRSN